MNELPSGWAECTLEDIADVNMGQSPPGSSYTTDGQGMPFLQGNAEFGPVVPTPVKRTTEPKKTTDGRAVLLSVRAPVGDTNLSPGEVAIGRGLAAITPRVGTDRRFLLWLLRAKRQELERKATGTTFPAVTARVVRSLPVWLPPRAEQDRIVETVEAWIAELESGLQELGSAELALARFQKSVLAAAVTGRLTAPVETSQSGAELLDEILCERQSDRSLAEPEPPPDVELPTNWTWATVDQLASLTQYGSSTKTDKDPEGVPVLRMGNIWDGRLRLDDLKYLPADHEEFPKLLLDNGDVLFNRTNSPELVGKAAVFRGELDLCSFASYLIRIRLDRRYRPELLVYYLNSALGRAWVGSVVSQQVGQANVNGSKLKKLTVPVPPLEEQVTICEMAETALTMVEETRKTISDARARADQLRRATLEGAVGGTAAPRNPS